MYINMILSGLTPPPPKKNSQHFLRVGTALNFPGLQDISSPVQFSLFYLNHEMIHDVHKTYLHIYNCIRIKQIENQDNRQYIIEFKNEHT